MAISTDASLTEMLPPGMLVMLTPLIVGPFFGVKMLAGVLAGSLVSGVQVAISMSKCVCTAVCNLGEGAGCAASDWLRCGLTGALAGGLSLAARHSACHSTCCLSASRQRSTAQPASAATAHACDRVLLTTGPSHSEHCSLTPESVRTRAKG